MTTAFLTILNCITNVKEMLDNLPSKGRLL